MWTQDRAADLFHRIRKHSQRGDLEVTIEGGSEALTRFANNGIHQNVAEEGVTASMRVQMDGKTARVTTDCLDGDSLRRAVKQCEELASVQESNPALPPMLTGREVQQLSSARLESPSRHFAETAATGPSERAAEVAKVVAVAKRHQQVAAGVFAVHETFEALFNSHGVEQWHAQTHAEVSVTMSAEDSSGWKKANSPDVRQLGAERMAEIAAEKAARSAKPRELAAGKYTVILEPSAALDFVGFMFYDFSATSVEEQRSFLSGRMGEQIFSPRVEIYDDCAHPLQTGPAWDGEGVPRERVQLVREGRPTNLVFSRAAARTYNAANLGSAAKPTGHGLPLPNDIGEFPANIVFALTAGEQARSVEQMVAETEFGLLVTRFWYIREVEAYEKILTGMTRDGTFLIERGRISGGVRNFRFNQGIPDALSHIVALGEPVRASGEEAFDMVVPAMKIEGFNFTEVTRF